MKILITNPYGFIGKNLIARLESQIKHNHILYKYDKNTSYESLKNFTLDCEFIFYLKEKPQEEKARKQEKAIQEDMEEDFYTILNLLKEHNNPSPILYTFIDYRFVKKSDYKDPLSGINEIQNALKKRGFLLRNKVIIYSLPIVFGKWEEPDSRSVASALCYNRARDINISISDPDSMVTLCYIDDVINSFLMQLKGEEKTDKDGFYRLSPNLNYRVSLKELEELITAFRLTRKDGSLPDVANPFIKKLYSTYLSYLPQKEFAYPLAMHKDIRGSFTEIFKTIDRGQISINITKPGIKKGEHYHHTKCEKFLVVSGEALIQFRRWDLDEVIDYYVSEEDFKIVEIPPGFTHSILNIGEKDLVTLIWANEIFNPKQADTYSLPLEL